MLARARPKEEKTQGGRRYRKIRQGSRKEAAAGRGRRVEGDKNRALSNLMGDGNRTSINIQGLDWKKGKKCFSRRLSEVWRDSEVPVLKKGKVLSLGLSWGVCAALRVSSMEIGCLRVKSLGGLPTVRKRNFKEGEVGCVLGKRESH